MLVAALLNGFDHYDKYLGPSLDCQDAKFDRIIEDNSDGHTTYGLFADRIVRESADDRIVIVHPDVVLGPSALSVIAEELANPTVGLTGIMGWPSFRLSRTGRSNVTIIDSCLMAFDRTRGLKIDIERFDGYHCVADDLAFQAAHLGLQVTVAGPFASIHHGLTCQSRDNGKRIAWYMDWGRYAHRIYAKWPNMRGFYEGLYPELAQYLAATRQ